MMKTDTKAATSLTVWRAALSIALALVGTVGAGAYFLAGLEGGVAANVTAIIAVEDDLSGHAGIAATRSFDIESRLRALEAGFAANRAKLDALALLMSGVEQLIKETHR